MAAVVEQNEKAYQKQPTIFAEKTRAQRLKGGKGKGKKRFTRLVGLGIKIPATATTGTYIDKKCPFTGNGVVKTHKMKRTLVVRRDYLHYIRKYNRFEKRHSNVPAHVSDAFRVEEGDQVLLGECRPLSKTVRFNVLQVTAAGGGKKGVKLFNKF